MLQEFTRLRKLYWGRHLWARVHLAVSSATIIDELIQKYIDQQEVKQVANDSQFPINQKLNLVACSR
jgi:putative transposase